MKEGKIPTINELPPGDPIRDVVAHQILKARKIDRKGRFSPGESRVGHLPRKAEMSGETWVHDRSGHDYIFSLQGLEATLQYVGQLESHLVLDVGTGTSRGISDIAKIELDTPLEFKGISVTRQPEFANYLGEDKVIITSAESLQGIENNSVGCIFAVRSISYSAAPEQVVARFDQVLVEGGVVKLKANVDENKQGHFGEKSADSFISAFKDMGYDVAFLGSVVLAIKPFADSTKPKTKAKDLIQQDKATILPPSVREKLVEIRQVPGVKELARKRILMRDGQAREVFISDEALERELELMAADRVVKQLREMGQTTDRTEKPLYKKEVVREILEAAQIEGVSIEDFELGPKDELYGPQGDLIYISYRLKEAAAQERGCGNIWYIYVLKGDHALPVGKNSTTCIVKATSTIEESGKISQSKIVLKYKEEEDKWIKP